MLLFEDLALVPIIFVLAALSPAASGDSAELILTTLWQGGLVVAALAIGGWFLLPKIFAQAARAKDPELFLAASLLVVIVAALATRSEEHTSELQSLMRISYAVFCLKKNITRE